MKKFILILAFLLSITNTIISQISRTDSFTLSAFKLSESLNINGDTIASIEYPDLQQIAINSIIALPVKQINYLVPANALSFKLNVTTENESFIELRNKDITLHDKKWNNYFENPIAIASTNNPHAVISNIGYLYGKYKIITIQILPCIPIPDHDKVSVSQKIKLDLTWTYSTGIDTNIINTINHKNTEDILTEISCIVENASDINSFYKSDTIIHRTGGRIGTNEYAIITPRRFIEDLRPLEAIWANKGFTTNIFALEDVINPNATGDPLTNVNDDASKLRAFIRNQYTVNGLQYLLLAGKYPEMPIRYMGDIPTDIYFSDLNTTWTLSLSGKFPLNYSQDRYPEVFVGRLPVNSSQDIRNFVEKMFIYEYQYDKTDLSYLGKGILTRQNGNMLSRYNNNVLRPFLNLFDDGNLLDMSAYEGQYITGGKVVQEINRFPAVIHNFIGHGNPGGVGVSEIEIADEKYSYGLLALENESWYHLSESGNGLNNLTNYQYPGWYFSNSCTLIPFDQFKNYTVKLNFGESYLIGGKYGGVLLMGNTRESQNWGTAMNCFYKTLEDACKSKNQYRKSIICSEINAIGLTTASMSLSDFCMRNIFGDPLTNLWAGIPERPKYSRTTNYNGIKINIENNFESYYIGFNNLNIFGYGNSTEYDSTTKSHHIPTNSLLTIFGKNIVPEILPVFLQNFTFNSTTQNTLLVKDLYAQSDLDPSCDKGNVTFDSSADVTIYALGTVDLDYGTIFQSGCKVKIYAKKDVCLRHLNVPAGATLYIEAPKIIWPEDHVTFASKANVILIENGKQVYPKLSKTIAKTRNSIPAPMVVEGRTWWYRVPELWKSERYIGYQIGSPIDLDGDSWFPVKQIKFASRFVPSYSDNTDWTVEDNEKTICHIRQEGNKVYTRVSSNYYIEENNWQQYYIGLCQHLLVNWLINPPAPTDEVSILEFELYGDEGDEFIYTSHDDYTDKSFAKFRFSEPTEISNSGKTYTQYKLTNVEDHLAINLTADSALSIPEFGYTVPQYWISELFFAPLGANIYESTMYEQEPKLQYVTDENFEILYEAQGGLKLWELDPTGIGNISADSVYIPETWHTVDGRNVINPESPGIYIRRKGSTSEKILIK
ncbi:MAG: hypothetical protein K2M19_04210 [Muribaculaceae bacterium]|nr:hypothetical protein [Muribaculaceae bacterium]